jgi:hypothetical protein
MEVMDRSKALSYCGFLFSKLYGIKTRTTGAEVKAKKVFIGTKQK